jgi:Fic family protein
MPEAARPPKKWGVTSTDFAERAAESPARAQSELIARGGVARDASRVLTTGRITWRPAAVDVDLIRRSSTDRSIFRFVKALPELVWNAAALEGNTFTLPQVQTLLDGVTVGGKKLEEAEQILALSEAMEMMIAAVRDGSFTLSKAMSDRIHGVVARHEAIESGTFRGEGSVQGGGSVRLARGGTIEGDPAGQNGEQLRADYANLLAALSTLDDPRARALVYFASATRSQFYFDGNKRTARIMMTGALIQSGFEPISIPYARQEEFNVALDELFRTNDATTLIEFLATCTLPDPS